MTKKIKYKTNTVQQTSVVVTATSLRVTQYDSPNLWNENKVYNILQL